MKQKLRVCFSVLLSITMLFTMCTMNLQAETKTITKDETGTHDGYFYSYWNEGGGSVSMTLNEGGNYGVEWKDCTRFMCGKGWKTGSPYRTVSFSGSFDGGINGYLALCGEIKSSGTYFNYYIIENYGKWTPPGSNAIGMMESDGGTYSIHMMERITHPGISIIAQPRHIEYFSVRTSRRASGTITFENHLKAWRSKGFPLSGTWDYQIMATEGYQSSGSANITVSGYMPEITPTDSPTVTPTTAPTATPPTATPTPTETRKITSDQTGDHDGYYYNFWNQGGGSVGMNLGKDGNFSVDWSNCSNFACGKGWRTGSPYRTVNFSGSFNGGNNGYLALYGETKNPEVEYYVIENHGLWEPPGGISLGTFESDGGKYKIYKMEKHTSISTIYQFFSVRTSRRSSGTITFENHVNAWKKKGLNLGTAWKYQIMGVEGYQSSGSANITVSGYIPETTPTNPPTATPTITKKYGDVNDDGIVDSADYYILRNYLLGKTSTLPSTDNADVNGDGIIDSGDYTLLRQYLLECIANFPV